jgi:arylsulfatase A-like enzyme
MTGDRCSIILVTVDCLRADHVGFMGYARPTTPFLDSLALESLVIPRAVVAGAPTYYSLPAILASRYPLALGRDVLGLAPDEPTLSSVFRKSGYSTAAFSAGNPYISERFGYDQGFDIFRDFVGSEPAPPIETKPIASTGLPSQLNRAIQRVRPALGPMAAVYDELYFRYCQRVTPVPSLDHLRRFPAADAIVNEACDWIASVGESPFFLWLHLMDPHSPYYPKQEALAAMEQGEVSPYDARYTNSFWNRTDVSADRLAAYREEVIALYDAGIRWADMQIGRLKATLEASGRWNDCIFALTADHGEEFLDHGGRYHPPDGLAEELVHVPLLLRVPRVSKTAVSRAPFSLIHLAPTLLDAAQIPAPPGFAGLSHWQQLQAGVEFDSFAIAECVRGCTNPFFTENRLGHRVLSVMEQRFKLVFFFDTETEFLYDLDVDPGEKHPVASDAHKTVRTRLLRIAREHLRQIPERDSRLRLQARLRELQLEWRHPANKPLPVTS